MKKITFAVWTALLIIFSSCEDNFDAKIYGSLTPENFPVTEKEYVAYAMTCYTPFTITWTYNLTGGNEYSFYVPAGGVLRMLEVTSDAAPQWKTGWGSEWLRLSQANYSNCVNYWRGIDDGACINHFEKVRVITRFTQIMGTIEKVSADVLPDTKKKNLLGEIRLCRGLTMYYMLHFYGPLPYILNPDDVFNEEALANMERPTLQQVTEWITADLEYAVENCPVASPERGRYSQDYARVCLMRHYLNEGSYMPGYYQKAIDWYNALKSRGYKLFDKGANPYAELFKNANKFNSEIIMAVSCSETADGNNNSGNFFPFMMLAVPGNAAKTDPSGNPTPFYLQGGGWGQNYNVAPKFYNTYDAADKRRDVVLTSYWTTGGIQVTPADIGNKWDGYVINKFPVETATPFQGTDFPLARWADVLLMYAEAEVRNSKAAPSADAVDAVNQVRARAGVGDLSPAEMASADAFLDAILLERGHEFLYEGMRKIDLIRFNRYAREVKKSKDIVPTHQYMPLPNYVIQQAENTAKRFLKRMNAVDGKKI